MAATVGSVLGDIEAFLYSLGHFRDRVATLTADLASSGATLLTVDDGTQLSKGLIEIDDELIYVKAADTGGNAQIPAWGRAQSGTAASAHTTGSRVRIHPVFPRSVMKRYLQASIDTLYPDLWKNVVDNTSVLYSSGTLAYSLPAAVESIVSISAVVQAGYPAQAITRFKFDHDADLTVFPTGRSIQLYQSFPSGTRINIVYRTGFGTFATEADSLSSLGLKDRWADILRDDVAARMVLAMEGADLKSGTAVSQARTTGTPFHAVNLSKALQSVVDKRVLEERRKLMLENPSAVNRQY